MRRAMVGYSARVYVEHRTHLLPFLLCKFTIDSPNSSHPLTQIHQGRNLDQISKWLPVHALAVPPVAETAVDVGAAAAA